MPDDVFETCVVCKSTNFCCCQNIPVNRFLSLKYSLRRFEAETTVEFVIKETVNERLSLRRHILTQKRVQVQELFKVERQAKFKSKDDFEHLVIALGTANICCKGSGKAFVQRFITSFFSWPRALLVLEAVKTESLSDRVISKKFRLLINFENVKTWAAQLLAGVGSLQKESLAHRNLSPNTIHLDRLQNLIITNFTLLKVLKDRTNTLCGTYNYIAPEVLSESRHFSGYSKLIDYFSIGCILKFLLANKEDSYPIESNLLKDLIENLCGNENIRDNFIKSNRHTTHKLFGFARNKKVDLNLIWEDLQKFKTAFKIKVI